MIEVRELGPSDARATAECLRQRADTTMILRSNLARAGLVDIGRTYSGSYVGAFDGGALVGVAALYWNGNIVVSGGAHTGALVEHLVRGARSVRGILGTAADVALARAVVERDGAHVVKKAHHEVLFALSLSSLVVPSALSRLAARTPAPHEMGLVLDWRMAYVAELSFLDDTPDERARQRELVDAFHVDGHDVLLFDEGRPVAFSGFNAEVDRMVQVGGVFTPPSLRGRGYARCAVAASLVAARERGAARAILFTGEGNVAAQRAYLSLGFEAIGDYALVGYR